MLKQRHAGHNKGGMISLRGLVGTTGGQRYQDLDIRQTSISAWWAKWWGEMKYPVNSVVAQRHRLMAHRRCAAASGLALLRVIR